MTIFSSPYQSNAYSIMTPNKKRLFNTPTNTTSDIYTQISPDRTKSTIPVAGAKNNPVTNPVAKPPIPTPTVDTTKKVVPGATPTPTKIVPDTTLTPTNPTDSYLKTLSANQSATEKLIGQSYDAMGKQYLPIISRLNTDISQEESNREAAVNAEKNRAQAELDKYNEDAGQQEKELAQNRIDNENRNRARFAMTGSGAFDAGGVGSFGAAQQRADTAYSGDLAKLKSQAVSARAEMSSRSNDKIAQLVRDSTTAIRNYHDKLSEIQNSMELNPVQKNMAILDARKAYDATVANIKQSAATQTTNLSAEFMRTGIPTNAHEVEFLQKNKDAMSAMNGSSNTVGDVVDAIKQITDKDLGGVYGWASVNPLNFGPESPAQLSRAKVDKLKSLLQLAAAGKLRGQGSITENERKILADSTTLLNNNKISPQQASGELQKLLATYLAKQNGQQSSVNSSGNPLGLSL